MRRHWAGTPKGAVGIGGFVVAEGPLFQTVMALVEAGDAGAEAYLMAALRERVEDPSAWTDAGMVLFRLGRWTDCCTCFEQAMALGDSGLDISAMLGLARYLTGSFDRAAESFLSVLRADPEAGEAWRGLGLALAARGNYEGARQSFETASRLLSDDAGIGDRLWRLKFQFGDWDEAWRHFDALIPADIEARWQALHGTRQALWRGEELAGKDLVVFSHGGHGDAIQHFRWIEPVLVGGAARVTAIVPPALVGLLNHSPIMAAFGPDRLRILAEGASIEDRPGYFTWWEGLARRFEARPERSLGAAPYLAVPAATKDAWRSRFASGGGKPLIGLSWAGSPAMPEDRWRSMPLTAFVPLFCRADARFVALQKAPLADDDRALLRAHGVIDLSEEIGNFTDTAGAIAALDRVIAVDSAVAHLAGALGAETWLLNRATSEWRWGWQQDTSFWYPKMRIFNQAEIGDWSGVVEAIAGES
jgi:tetratricopeptide (TPR) repeat protein